MTEDLFSEDERWILREYKQEQDSPLRREMESILRATSVRDMQVFQKNGIPAAKLYGDSLLGASHVEVGRNDLWQPMETGSRCIITVARECGRTMDLVAFRPSNPDEWFLRVGNAWALGMDAITDAQGIWSDKDRLFLHPTPLDWLRAGGRGACVIDWTHEARSTLRELPSIDVGSPRFAQALRLELSRPPRLPEIETKRMRRDAA